MSITSSTAMDVSDAELRAMVRAAIARLEPPGRHERHTHETLHLHISHARLPVTQRRPAAPTARTAPA